MRVREGQLEFDFTGCIAMEKLDRRNTPVPAIMKKADFLVEEEDQYLLIEVKDPSDTRTINSSRSDFIRKIKHENLISNSLVPKCRDSWTFLHLMRRDNKKIIYVVVLSIREHKPMPETLGFLQTELERRLRKEGKRVWQKQYVEDCVIVNVTGWNIKFRRYRVTRIIGD